MAAEEILPRLREEVYGDLMVLQIYVGSALSWIKDHDVAGQRYLWSKHHDRQAVRGST
jgi:hypothetical protein